MSTPPSDPDRDPADPDTDLASEGATTPGTSSSGTSAGRAGGDVPVDDDGNGSVDDGVEASDWVGGVNGPDVHDDGDDEDLEEIPRGRGARWVLALLLVIALIVPLSRVFIDELDFGRSADQVEAHLGTGDPLLDAVVMVRTVGCNGQVTTGSAFSLQVDDEVLVVTNRHVVERARSIGVRPLSGGTLERVRSTRVARDLDVAVLTLDPEAPAMAPLQPADAIPNGAAVQIVGFPGGRPAVHDGTLREQVGPRLLLNVSVQQGSSGSPVVDSNGDVVGQVVARTNEGQGIALSVDAVIDATGSTVPLAAC